MIWYLIDNEWIQIEVETDDYEQFDIWEHHTL